MRSTSSLRHSSILSSMEGCEYPKAGLIVNSLAHHCGQKFCVLLCHGGKRGRASYESIAVDRLLHRGRGQLAPCEAAHKLRYLVN